MGELSKSFHNIAREDRAACALARVGTLPTLQTLSVPPLHNLSFMEEEVYIRQMTLFTDAFEGEGAALPASPLSFLPCLIFISVLTSSFTEKYPVSPAPSTSAISRPDLHRTGDNDAIQRAL